MQLKHTLTLLLITAGLNSYIALASEANNSPKSCINIGDDSERLACFDAWAQGAFKMEEAESNNEALGSSESETSSLPETLGGDKFDPAKQAAEANRGKVVSCRLSANNRWLFVFDSGQVWKQTDSRRRNFKNCDFLVTMTKDGFGYKMFIEEKKTRVRVRRIK